MRPVTAVKIRITRTPVEYEIDGVKLSTLTPGSVKDVSSTLGFWLIAQGYAWAEMRTGAARREPSPTARASKGMHGDIHHRALADRRRKR
jgi:hypothetical protein